MSKIGRKPIDIGSVAVEVSGQEVRYKGSGGSGVYTIPDVLKIELQDGKLSVAPAASDFSPREVNAVWGLHRALLANTIHGVGKGFERQIKIVGLGYRASASGSKINLALGYSHKLEYILPDGVSIEINKSGQVLTLRSANKEKLGLACSQIRALRPPEPYKGTGIQYADEVIRRKAGKAKA